MIFEKESLGFTILDVIELHQKDINSFNSGRTFNALSFRTKADTLLRTESKEYVMTDNSVAYVPARLDYTRISAEDELIVIHFYIMNYQSKEIELFVAKDPEKMSELFRRILSVWNAKETGYRYRCTALLYEIFAECHAQIAPSAVKSSKIQKSVDYIHENYKNGDITIADVAKRSFMSEVYFRKLFKEEYGVSPQKYIVNLRIQNAAGLISTGYYSLKEVALMSGYNDYKYFSVEFKRIMGISPSEYFYNFEE